jgi:hypothetical protein
MPAERHPVLDNAMEWERLDQILDFRTKWLTLLGEKWRDDKGAEVEYWRVEKPDSVIVLPLQGASLLLPRPAFRPGVRSVTIDFPGGRVKGAGATDEAVREILKRELGVEASAVIDMKSLNKRGWLINSSFSSQKLYAYVCEIDDGFSVPSSLLGRRVSRDMKSLETLLDELQCLQCRSVLLGWLREEAGAGKT